MQLCMLCLLPGILCVCVCVCVLFFVSLLFVCLLFVLGPNWRIYHHPPPPPPNIPQTKQFVYFSGTPWWDTAGEKKSEGLLFKNCELSQRYLFLGLKWVRVYSLLCLTLLP